MPITGVFRITHIKWTDGYKNALVVLKFNRFPTCTHMKIMLRSVKGDMAAQLPKKYLKMLKKIQETDKSSPRMELELVSQLKLFHYQHSPLDMKQQFYVFDYFPLFSDSLEYEMTIEPLENAPQFIQGVLEGNIPMRISKIHGIYRDLKKKPTQMILWMSQMQSNRSIKSASLKKYNKFVDWGNLTQRDVELVPNFREPRMNHRSKQFIRSVIKDCLDSATAKLVPWVKTSVLKLLSPLEKQIIVRSITESIDSAFDFDFEIHSPQLFQLWFGHEPTKEFEDALAFKQTLRNHMYGTCITGPNKYLKEVRLAVKQYIGNTGTMGLPGKEDVGIQVFYTMRSLYNRYEKVMTRFRSSKIIIGTPSCPQGLAVTCHPDDTTYWRQTADVDEVCLISELRYRDTQETAVTLYNSHKYDFQHWILLERYIHQDCNVTICGRLDQYNSGKVGQVFRDLVELRGGPTAVEQSQVFLSNEVYFVKKVADIPDDVEQVFTSAWSKDINSKWLHEHSEKRWNKIWLHKPRRVRTVKIRNDGGWTKFVEEGEPALRIFNIEKYESADVVPVHRWNGRLLNSAAFIIDPEKTKNSFDLYTVRTFARKVYFVGVNTLPADSGRLPSRRTLRHVLDQ